METFNIRKRKNFFETKPEQQRRNKIKINELLTNLLKEFNSFISLEYGVKIHSVNIVPATGKYDEFFLKTNIIKDASKLDKIVTHKTISTQTQQTSFNKLYDKKNDDIIYTGLKAKDMLSLSKRKFNIMKKILFNDKRYRKLTFCRVDLLKLSIDSIFPIKKNTEGNGFYFDVESKVTYFVSKFLNSFHLNDLNYLNDDIILLKFGADGANVTRTRFKIINLTFTILNQWNSTSVNAQHILAMAQINTENYDETKIALSDVFKEIGKLDKLTIKNKTYLIKKYLSSDMKMLANLYGLNSANANQGLF